MYETLQVIFLFRYYYYGDVLELVHYVLLYSTALYDSEGSENSVQK